MSAIATKAGIQPGDSPDVMARKIREWIEKSAPDLTLDGFKCQFELAWNAVTAIDGPRKLAGKAASYAWGGSRPHTGGSRPLSGPLKVRITLRPFAWAEKGDSHSSVTIRVERCNRCGAMGREVEGETVFRYGQPEDQGLSEVPGVAGQPLVHSPDCPHGE